MSHRSRRRVQPRLTEILEGRHLLAAPVVVGNLGRILQSQFQPFGFKTTVGHQFARVRLGGPLRVDVASPTAASTTATTPAVNTGLIDTSQFNGGGFRTIGLQWQRVRVGGGVTVLGSDNEAPGTSGTGSAGTTNERTGTRFRTVANKGSVAGSQLNDGGFGVLDQTPDGQIIGRAGRVGLQWRNSRVGGPVDVGIDVQIVQPGTMASRVATAAVAPETTAIDPSTNTGQIRDSQFNDGGFGDIGMQWSQVAVGQRVATSTNSLFIQPQGDDGEPITVTDRTLGQRQRTGVIGGRTATEAARRSSLLTTAAAATPGQDPLIPSTATNAATSSGRITGAQFNDGGFGDVGLQWNKVRVRGAGDGGPQLADRPARKSGAGTDHGPGSPLPGCSPGHAPDWTRSREPARDQPAGCQQRR